MTLDYKIVIFGSHNYWTLCDYYIIILKTETPDFFLNIIKLEHSARCRDAKALAKIIYTPVFFLHPTHHNFIIIIEDWLLLCLSWCSAVKVFFFLFANQNKNCFCRQRTSVEELEIRKYIRNTNHSYKNKCMQMNKADGTLENNKIYQSFQSFRRKPKPANRRRPGMCFPKKCFPKKSSHYTQEQKL